MIPVAAGPVQWNLPAGRSATFPAVHRALPALACALALGSCRGEHVGPGEPTAQRLPEARVAAREVRQAAARATVGAADGKQILFGDLHVHTGFSPDAFLMSLPMLGGSGLHPPADACDFARFCADLDFWSINDHAEGISPRHWRETIESIERCNAIAGSSGDPDVVAFLGWEWTQVGSTPADHYGHKNVILLETGAERVPRRPIAAPRPEFRVTQLPAVGRILFPLLHFSERRRYFDYQRYAEDMLSVPPCPEDLAPDSAAECFETAATPKQLFGKLDRWGGVALVIPHGTSWGLMTPPGFSIARELAAGQHDPRRQRLFEIYSGHGSAEAFRDWPGAVAPEESERSCPEPTSDFLPCCWRAGEIIRSRCEDPASADCEQRVREARGNYVSAGTAGHHTVPGVTAEEWLDCDQCRDCFNPAFSHRPGGSAQYALALTRPGDGERSRRYRWGHIGSSDTHDARAGNGFKEFSRIENTEAPYRPPLVARLLADRRDPVARSEPVTLGEVPLGARRYVERGASFFLTGGLAAVHASSRDRRAIWEALARREVYATSGERILLWFELANAPDGAAPMGSEVAHMVQEPRFRVAAAGAFEQRPGCPSHVSAALPPERLRELCLGECYHPGERRRAITRIEVVKVRSQRSPDEPVADLVEDPWRVLPCPARAEGCRVEFDDPAFLGEDREVVYYVRAIQEPTLAVNAGGLRCERDASGACVRVRPCYWDDRTAKDDDCLAENEERAWSSPIFVRPPGA
jgi:hypothetical protein